MINIMLV